MASLSAWKEHFLKMARGKLPVDENVVVVQRGRGLGRVAYQRASYKIREPAPAAAALAPSAIVSPVAQGVLRAQAKKREERTGIKGPKSKSRVTKRSKTGKKGAKPKNKKKDKKKKKKKTK